ncbi:hypothetical protein E2C01_093815 [Portunus trituberculatus]|uniref:Secreted protein n=1 Tax=Portunus trituberculatus TaxID=210409 RepID=A0A5B7K1E1_PORTR|nr:hypothetical protein [Portunus trituberculatus]
MTPVQPPHTSALAFVVLLLPSLYRLFPPHPSRTSSPTHSLLLSPPHRTPPHSSFHACVVANSFRLTREPLCLRHEASHPQR